MSSQSTARSLPTLEASPLDQAADLVDEFALQRSLEALSQLTAVRPQAKSPRSLDEVAAMAESLADQCRLVDEEIARYLAVQQKD